jgi:ankyrin repeat protein
MCRWLVVAGRRLQAAWRGNREVVEALVKAGADTTVSNGAGQQPFALAKDSAVAALLEPSSASGTRQTLPPPSR